MKSLIPGLFVSTLLASVFTSGALAVKTEISSSGGLNMSGQLKAYQDQVLLSVTKECLSQGADKNTAIDLTVDGHGNIVQIVLGKSGLSSDATLKLLTTMKSIKLGDAGDNQSDTLRIKFEFSPAEVLAGAKSTGTAIKVTGGSVTGDGTATGSIRIGGGGSISAGGSINITSGGGSITIGGGDSATRGLSGRPDASQTVTARIARKSGPEVFMPGDKAFVAQIQSIMDTLSGERIENDVHNIDAAFADTQSLCDNIRGAVEGNDLESAKNLAGEIGKRVDDCSIHKFKSTAMSIPIRLAGNQINHTATWLAHFADAPTYNQVDGDIAESLYQSAYKLKLKANPFDQFTLINLDQFCSFLEKNGKTIESAALWKQAGKYLESTAGSDPTDYAPAKKFYTDAGAKVPGRMAKH